LKDRTFNSQTRAVDASSAEAAEAVGDELEERTDGMVEACDLRELRT
jgi:hypothetical protein